MYYYVNICIIKEARKVGILIPWFKPNTTHTHNIHIHTVAHIHTHIKNTQLRHIKAHIHMLPINLTLEQSTKVFLQISSHTQAH